MTPRRLLIPMGTRPEVVKLAPVVQSLRAVGNDIRTIATGQHHDPRLAGNFFADLDLRPDEEWDLPDIEAGRVGAILTRAFTTLAGDPPDAVVVLGDTYTVPLLSLAARRFAVPVVHLEAGLRSFNPRSLEEVNRRAVAAMASLHLAPTPLAARHLEQEGVAPERVRVVGNPVTDSLRRFGPVPVAPRHRRGVLVTAHRADNVDDHDRLAELVRLVAGMADEVGPVRFPIHPRTRHGLEAAGLIAGLARHSQVRLEEPLRYRDMLDAIASARVIVTDSGGLQEEAAWFGVPVVVLRRSTPRWESVAARTATLVGMDADRAIRAALAFDQASVQDRVAALPCPYGDGHVADRVAKLLSEPETWSLLELTEPNFVTLDDRRPSEQPA